MKGMANHPTPLASEPSGDAKEVSWFAAVIKNIRQRSIRVGPGLRASYGMDGTLIEIERKASSAVVAGGGGIKRLQLWAQGINYYRTYEDDGNGNFNVVGPNVAVPFFYRASTYDLGASGANYTGGLGFSLVGGEIRAHGANAGDYLVKALFPSYAIGQYIYAGEVEDGTDVYATPPATDRVTWVDLTARTLITVPRDFSICRLEGGQPVTRVALIDGGPPH